MDKQAEDALIKLGSEKAASFIASERDNIEHEHNNTELVKKAEEIINELGADGIGFFKEAEAVGRGIAIGQTLAKEAGIDDETYDQIYGQLLSAVTDVFGEKTANELDDGLNKASEEAAADPQLAEVKAKIEEGVTPVVIEALGGEAKLKDAVKDNPELAKEVVKKIDEVVKSVIADVSSGATQPESEKSE